MQRPLVKLAHTDCSKASVGRLPRKRTRVQLDGMTPIPPGCAGCSLRPEALYENRYLRKDEKILRKPAWKWKKPPYWNPPTIYQRSYMPVQSDVVRAGPPPSTWKRPSVRLDGISTYIHDYSCGSYKRPKWTHHPRDMGKKKPEVRISEYDDRYRLLTPKQFEKATHRVEVPVKVNARRSAGFSKTITKPPMFTSTMYSSTYKPPAPPKLPPVTPM